MMSLLYRARAGETPAPPWMITLADLLGIMVCFFILLYSMSSPRDDGFRSMAASLGARLNPDRAAVPRAPAENIRLSTPRAIDLGYLDAVIADKAADSAFANAVILRTADRLLLGVAPERLFDGSGINAAGQRAIADLAQAMRFVANKIEIVGHVDPAGPGAWEQGLLRAQAAAGAFRSAGYERPVAVRAAAATEALRAGWIAIAIREGAE